MSQTNGMVVPMVLAVVVLTHGDASVTSQRNFSVAMSLLEVADIIGGLYQSNPTAK